MRFGSSKRWDLLAGAVAIAVLLSVPLYAADEPPLPPYPRVNMAICYQVDPAWPQRPSNIQWGGVPGITVGRQGEVWMSTRAKPPIECYDHGGKFLRGWGGDSIKSVHFVRLDPQGNVWVADVGDHVIMQFTPQGKLLRTLGTRGKPGADETHFCLPTDMAVTPAGDIFVSDGYGNSRIVHFDKHGKFVKTWGKLGTRPGEFSIAHSIVMDSKGRLYVADRNNVRIQVFEQSGKFIAEWRNLLVPFGLYMTAADELWACGSSPTGWRATDTTLGVPFKDHLVMKFDTSGRVLQLWTLPKGEGDKERPGEVNLLHGMAVDADGNLYLGDIGGQRMQKFVRQQ